MRRTELLSLYKSQVDFVRGSILLTHTKNGRPRTIPIHEAIEPILRRLCEEAGPSVIQNAEQVNIAAEGGQQVNVKRGKGGKRIAKAGGRKKTSTRKQLSAAKGSINLEPASESVLKE